MASVGSRKSILRELVVIATFGLPHVCTTAGREQQAAWDACLALIQVGRFGIWEWMGHVAVQGGARTGVVVSAGAPHSHVQ